MGMSGGGYMTLLMAGRHPELWAAASAWVGINDVGLWYADHGNDTYGAMMRRCFGGAPGSSDSVTAEYRARSPITWLPHATALPVDIAAGRDDPEVPMSHSVQAFNGLARAIGSEPVNPDELAELTRPQGMLSRPTVADTAADPVWARRLWLRRLAGPSRLTIFDGVHEWLPGAVLDWLDRHTKP
jgi:predicted peptidase